MRKQAAVELRTELLPELKQLKGSVDHISQIISWANETVMLINTLPPGSIVDVARKALAIAKHASVGFRGQSPRPGGPSNATNE
jgi:hypothetical protein